MKKQELLSIKDGNVVVDFGPVPLRHALRDPDDVAALLLLELEEGVEDAEVKLLHKGVHVQANLVLEKLVL